MGEGNIEEFGAVVAGEPELRPLLERDAGGMRDARPEDLLALWSTLLGPADRAVAVEKLAAWIIASAARGLGDGVDGWLDDDFAFLRPWGFAPASIGRPVLLLHGEDDRFVPVAHGHWLAERIPGVEARITADDGHLTLLENRISEVHEWLLAHF